MSFWTQSNWLWKSWKSWDRLIVEVTWICERFLSKETCRNPFERRRFRTCSGHLIQRTSKKYPNKSSFQSNSCSKPTLSRLLWLAYSKPVHKLENLTKKFQKVQKNFKKSFENVMRKFWESFEKVSVGILQRSKPRNTQISDDLQEKDKQTKVGLGEVELFHVRSSVSKRAETVKTAQAH